MELINVIILLLLMPVIWQLYRLTKFIFVDKSFRRSGGGMEVVKRENNEIWTFAGEMDAEKWKHYVEIAKTKPHLKHFLIAGPKLKISEKTYRQYVNENPDSRTGKLRDPNLFFDSHPVLKYFSENTQNMRLFFKSKPLESEKHFSIGLSSRVVFSEKHHGDCEPTGGWVYFSANNIFDDKKEEFLKLVNNSSYCKEVVPNSKDAMQIASQTEFFYSFDNALPSELA